MTTDPTNEIVSPAAGAAGDIIAQVESINELEIKFLGIIDIFPQSAARQIATQRFMECTFWLAEALSDNP